MDAAALFQVGLAGWLRDNIGIGTGLMATGADYRCCGFSLVSDTPALHALSLRGACAGAIRGRQAHGRGSWTALPGVARSGGGTDAGAGVHIPNSLRELPPAMAANVGSSSPAEARCPTGSLSAMSNG